MLFNEHQDKFTLKIPKINPMASIKPIVNIPSEKLTKVELFPSEMIFMSEVERRKEKVFKLKMF